MKFMPTIKVLMREVQKLHEEPAALDTSKYNYASLFEN